MNKTLNSMPGQLSQLAFGFRVYVCKCVVAVYSALLLGSWCPTAASKYMVLRQVEHLLNSASPAGVVWSKAVPTAQKAP